MRADMDLRITMKCVKLVPLTDSEMRSLIEGWLGMHQGPAVPPEIDRDADKLEVGRLSDGRWAVKVREGSTCPVVREGCLIPIVER